MRNIINVLNWKNNENVKDKRKENIITVIIENDKRDITIKNDIKSLRTIIGNQIEIVNENKDMKNDKNIKEINDKKLIIKRIWNNKKNDIKNKNENINIKNIIRLLRTIIKRLLKMKMKILISKLL